MLHKRYKRTHCVLQSTFYKKKSDKSRKNTIFVHMEKEHRLEVTKREVNPKNVFQCILHISSVLTTNNMQSVSSFLFTLLLLPGI